MKRKVLPGLLVFLIFSCDQLSMRKENRELSKKLVGEWRNVSIKIKMNSYKNADASKDFEVNEKNWEDKMHIKPIRTFYRENSTYNSEHRNLNDSIIYNPAGKWIILDDTLEMIDTFPQRGKVYKYKLFIRDNIAEFTSIEDCDNDGWSDDNYFGVQRKQ
jgi:hypothetical protein